MNSLGRVKSFRPWALAVIAMIGAGQGCSPDVIGPVTQGSEQQRAAENTARLQTLIANVDAALAERRGRWFELYPEEVKGLVDFRQTLQLAIASPLNFGKAKTRARVPGLVPLFLLDCETQFYDTCDGSGGGGTGSGSGTGSGGGAPPPEARGTTRASIASQNLLVRTWATAPVHSLYYSGFWRATINSNVTALSPEYWDMPAGSDHTAEVSASISYNADTDTVDLAARTSHLAFITSSPGDKTLPVMSVGHDRKVPASGAPPPPESGGGGGGMPDASFQADGYCLAEFLNYPDGTRIFLRYIACYTS